MGILGNVENGWFAQLAHACKATGQHTLNFISCGGNWGDKLYSNMENAANIGVGAINRQAIDQALAHGATQQQALSAGSEALEKVANPQSLPELAKLATQGSSVALQSVKDIVAPPMSMLGALMPLLIGAGVLGGAYLLASSFNGSSSTQAVRRQHLAY